jgi:DNA-binding NtrC family response regulator
VITVSDFARNVPGLSHLAPPPLAEAGLGTRPPPAPAGLRGVRPSDVVYAEVVAGASLPELKRQLEQACIVRALRDADGNITRAAELLGMKRSRLSQLVNQHGLKAEGGQS